MAESRLGLSIGPSEPTGTGGVQADIKAFSSLGLHGAAVVTSLSGLPVSAGQLAAQLAEAPRADVVKVTPPLQAELLEAVVAHLEAHPPEFLVVDPAGANEAGETAGLLKRLVAMAYVVTPNLAEAAALSGRAISTWEDAREAAAAIAALGAANVVITGGKQPDELATDLLFDGKDYRDYAAERVELGNVTGMGTVFAAGLAASLAKGETVQHAVAAGKAYVTKALQSTYERDRRPMLHLFYRYWRPSSRS